MSVQAQVMEQMKAAMKSKDTVALEALRALKSAFLLANTSGSNVDLSSEDEIKIVQKLVKQRKDSAAIFQEQDRNDLADPELAQAKILEQYTGYEITRVTYVKEDEFHGYLLTLYHEEDRKVANLRIDTRGNVLQERIIQR